MRIKLIVYSVISILFLCLLMYAHNASAMDMEREYYQEKVTYIIAYGKPLPERNVFTCLQGKLKKGYHQVRNFKGVNVGCELKLMTRREYEDLNLVSRTF